MRFGTAAYRPNQTRRRDQQRPRKAMTRELLTTAEAATYCGFKSTSALRKAKLEGRLLPAGRRGGRGTWMWRRSDLDEFLVGKVRDTVAAGRPSTPLTEVAHGQNTLEISMEALSEANALTWNLEDARRRLHSPAEGDRPLDGPPAGTEEGVLSGHRTRRLRVVG